MKKVQLLFNNQIYICTSHWYLTPSHPGPSHTTGPQRSLHPHLCRASWSSQPPLLATPPFTAPVRSHARQQKDPCLPLARTQTRCWPAGGAGEAQKQPDLWGLMRMIKIKAKLWTLLFLVLWCLFWFLFFLFAGDEIFTFTESEAQLSLKESLRMPQYD